MQKLNHIVHSVIGLALPLFMNASFVLAQLPHATTVEIDNAVEKVLLDTGTPSISLAVVKDGKLAYVRAYGDGRLDPKTPAQPEMRYCIGSVSKQFLACAILLLEQEGKLSLNDRVSKYLPDLTRGDDISIRQLLSHTAGYQDYYPLDYVAPFMEKPVTTMEIITRWACKPLDFEPGTQWQYSNTGYVVAGHILEMVAGVPLMDFLRSRIFGPLGMTRVLDLDSQSLTVADAQGYIRFGLGSLHPARPEASGWLFAAGELAMTARDLALWDISLIEKKLLNPASLDAMMTPPRLQNGAPLGYALGVEIKNQSGHPVMQHGGSVSGFVTSNTIWPDQGIALVVLSNRDNSGAPSSLSDKIGQLLLKENLDSHASIALEQAQAIFTDLQQGKIDRSLLTSDANTYFSPQVLAEYGESLRPLGIPSTFEQTSTGLRGGYRFREFRITFSNKVLKLTTYAAPDDKLGQYLVRE
jgi:D-alanyl-D-alanine carboxypeptidase